VTHHAETTGAMIILILTIHGCVFQYAPQEMYSDNRKNGFLMVRRAARTVLALAVINVQE
jgi:PBP1b-binding outer membrane lipoprotein LpoB